MFIFFFKIGDYYFFPVFKTPDRKPVDGAPVVADKVVGEPVVGLTVLGVPVVGVTVVGDPVVLVVVSSPLP